MKNKQDKDSKGHRVNYYVEWFAYTNHLRSDTETLFEKFSTKVEAEKWVQEQIMQGLGIMVKVDKLTYDNPNNSFLPTWKTILKTNLIDDE